MVVLGKKSYPYLLKPPVGIGVAELLQQSPHKTRPARIDRLHAAYTGETVGEVASPATSDSHLCQRFPSAFKDDDLCQGQPTFYLNGGKTSCRTGSDY